MQITALSTGLFQHLSNILAGETEHGGELQVHLDVQFMLSGNTEALWSTTLTYLMHAIKTADFGTLDKVKDHSEMNKAAGDAAQAFVSTLVMAISKVLKIADKETSSGRRI